MTASNRERTAIAVFLATLRDERQAQELRRKLRRELVRRTKEDPEKVLLYLNSLPKGSEKQDHLLRLLRKTATEAKFKAELSNQN